MTPIPLDQLRLFGWEHHKSALWWLALLYRGPQRFRKSLEKHSRREQAAAGLGLYGHALPYLFVACALGRLLVFGVFRVNMLGEGGNLGGLRLIHTEWIVLGIGVGIVLGAGIGAAAGIAEAIVRNLAFGTPYGITVSIAYSIILGVGAGVVCGTDGEMGGPIAIGLVSGIAAGIAMAIGAGVSTGTIPKITRGPALTAARSVFAAVVWIGFLGVLGLAAWITFDTALGIGRSAFWIATWAGLMIGGYRAFYWIPHVFFVFPRMHPTCYTYHPLAWDGFVLLPFWRLDRLLAGYAEQSPDDGEREIERLIDGYREPRMAALRARTILLAREAARVKRLTPLEGIVTRLPEGEKKFLKQTGEVRELVEDLCRVQTRLDTMERPFLRAPYAEQLVTKIENFRHRIAGFYEPLRSEFRKAGEAWLPIAERQLADVKGVLDREPTLQPFRAGDPVERDKEAFVARYGVVGELEQQVTLATGCPGLILYGRRRTGKSTVQANLGGFLPQSVSTMTLSMQNPEAFTSIESFVGTLSTRVQDAINADFRRPPNSSKRHPFLRA